MEFQSLPALCYNACMKPQDFWTTYVGDQSPEKFMLKFQQTDPAESVHRYLEHRPSVFGVLRADTWRITFKDEAQHRRDIVSNALVAHLEATRDSWVSALVGFQAEKQEGAAPTQHPAENNATQEQSPPAETPPNESNTENQVQPES